MIRFPKTGTQAAGALFVILTLFATLLLAFAVFRLAILCPACVSVPNAYYVSWTMFGLLLASPSAYFVFWARKRYGSDSSSVSTSKVVHWVFFTTALVLVSFLSVIRFILDFNPQGSDTPNYLYVSNLILNQYSPQILFGDGRELTFLTLTALRVINEGVLHQSSQFSMMIFPVLLSNLLSLSVFRLVRAITGDFVFGTASMALSGLSFFLLRMSYDLFAQMLGVSIMLLLFGSLIPVLGRSAEKRQLKHLAVFSTALILAHAYTWIIAILVIGLYVSMALLERVKIAVKPVLTVLLPGIAYFILVRMTSSLVLQSLPMQWYERTVATPSIIQGIIFALQTGNFSPLKFSFLNDATVGLENPLILTAAALGAVLVLRPQRGLGLSRLLSSWILVIMMFLFLGFSQQYRLIILLPVGILAGIGVAKVSRFRLATGRFHFSFSTRFHLKLSGRTIALLAIVWVCFVFSVPKAFAPEYIYYPGQEGIMQLELVRELYGFGSPRVLVLVQDEGFVSNNFQWARAITGANVYQGFLLDLVQRKPFMLGGAVPVDIDLSTIDFLVIPPAMYAMGNFELCVSTFQNGLYVIRDPGWLYSSTCG